MTTNSALYWNPKILFLEDLYNYYWQTGIEFSLPFYSLIRNKISRAFIVCRAIFILLPLGYACLVSEKKNSNSHHPILFIFQNLISFVLINMMKQYERIFMLCITKWYTRHLPLFVYLLWWQFESLNIRKKSTFSVN